MKNAELILVDSTCNPSKKYTNCLDSAPSKLTWCCGPTSCPTCARVFLAWVYSITNLASGAKLTLKVPLCSCAIFMNTKPQKYLSSIFQRTRLLSQWEWTLIT
jgi:hypothetical protein